MNNPVTTRDWIGRRRLRASVDRTLGVKVPKAVFDEAEAYARRASNTPNFVPRVPSCSICWKSPCPARRTAFTTVIPGVAAVRAGEPPTKQAPWTKHAKAAGKNVIQYIGIAADEQKRLQRLPLYKVAPLAKFGFTEADALAYCYDHGFFWEENGIRLYDVLDRVSCWCCANKNLKELRNIRTHLPKHWNRLKDIQSRTDRPMKGPGKSVFDLEERFRKEAEK